MKNPQQALRAFLITLCGVAIGIAVAKLSGGSMALVIAIALGVATFAFLRLRDR